MPDSPNRRPLTTDGSVLTHIRSQRGTARRFAASQSRPRSRGRFTHDIGVLITDRL